jgi:hypothetical protein
MGFEKQGHSVMSNDYTSKGGSDCPEPGKGAEGVVFVGEGSVTIRELGAGGFGR